MYFVSCVSQAVSLVVWEDGNNHLTSVISGINSPNVATASTQVVGFVAFATHLVSPSTQCDCFHWGVKHVTQTIASQRRQCLRSVERFVELPIVYFDKIL